MRAFKIGIPHGEGVIGLTIIPKDDYFIIAQQQHILGATRKEGSDWILMQRDEIEEWYLTDHENNPDDELECVELGAIEINQIAGEIENQLK